MTILTKIVKNHQAPWLSGDFGENGDFGEKKLAKNANLAQTAKTRQRAGNIQNVANIQIVCQRWPLQIGYLKRSHSYFKATFLKTIFKLDNKL